MNSRRIAVLALAVVATLMVFATLARPAYALLEDDWPAGSLSSNTNPGDLSVRETSWRWNWGNSLNPQVLMSSVPQDEQIATTGFLYVLDQNPTTVPSVVLQPVEFSSESTGTLFDQSFDILGIMAGRGYTPQLGAVIPGEGQWWMHIRLVNPIRAEHANGTLHVPLGVDLTAPDPVQNLRATIDGSNAVTGWTAYSRRVLRWDRKDYDLLSGAGAFEVSVNGVVRTKALCPMPDPRTVWWADERGLTPTSTPVQDPDAITLESLPPGEAKIDITVIDRATNRSTPVTVYAYSDPDTPTVSLTTPAADGEVLDRTTRLAADAADAAGVKAVGFYVDGSIVGTVTPSAASTTCAVEQSVDWTAIANGSHLVTAKVIDQLGRAVVSTKVVTLDKSLPKPITTVVQPFSGQALPSSAPFKVNASDTVGIRSVDFAVDGVNVGRYAPSAGAPRELSTMILADISGFSAGPHTLTTTVTNSLGNRDVSTVGFVYDPTAALSRDLYVAVNDPENAWGGVTSTNPYGVNGFMRGNWGNSLYPQVEITTPTVDPQSAGSYLLYTFDRSPNSTIDVSRPGDYLRSVAVKGTHMTGTFDAPGALAQDPTLDGRSIFKNRATQPAEGWWYVSMAMVQPDGTHKGTYRLALGVDVTKPSRPTGLKAFASATSTTPLSSWVGQRRVHLRWDSKEYDTLSGTAYYRVYVDGKCVVPGEVPLSDPGSGEQGVPWYLGAESGSLTLEDLSPGQHTIQVTAVDRATNESAMSDPVQIAVDDDVPTVSLTSPGEDGKILGRDSKLAAVATDQGGVKAVGFYVDGSSVGTITASSVTTSFSPETEVDWQVFSSGSHTITARVIDQLGRAALSTRTVTLDKTLPKPRGIIAQPVAGQRLPSRAPIRVVARDEAGITAIGFAIDGVSVGSYVPDGGSAPSVGTMILADMAAFSPGTHTLAVTVRNAYGNTLVESTSFVYDPSALLSDNLYWPINEADDVWSGTTTTNPNATDEPASFWRESWGNSIYPQVEVTSPTVDPLTKPYLLYTFDRTPARTIDPDDAASYLRSTAVKGTNIAGTFDVPGILAASPGLDGRAYFPGKASQAAEGWWYLSMNVVSGNGAHTGTYRVPFGIDLTKPSAVTGVKVYADATTTTPVSAAWTSNRRVHVRWDAKEYDKLSGTAYFRVYVDDACVVPGDVPLSDPASGTQGVPWYLGASSGSITLEDLAAGNHTIQVTAVDRATNESVRSSIVRVGVDDSAPTVSWVTPAANQVVGVSPTFLVSASDTGGVKSVKFLIDGKLVYTDTTAPYSCVPSVGSYAAGTHTAVAVATDMMGRTATASRSFVIDRSAPRISAVTAGPKPFYPRKRDRYRDDLSVKFKLSERANVDMLVYRSSGKLWRIVKLGTKNAGSQSAKWDGKSNSGKIMAGDFKVRLRATDAAGNTGTSAFYKSTIKFYRIVRVGKNGVRVVQL